MTEIPSISNAIRSELVDIAREFLKNPKISNEQMERKREFLKKKGLTDTEINYAFQLIPQQEITKEIIPNHRRGVFSDLIFAGFLVFTIQILKQFFHSNQSNQKIELNEIIKNLQKSVHDMQTSVVKLEQTTDQLNLTLQTSNPKRTSSIEELKQEIQGLKGLFLGRSQVSSTASDDGIIVLSEEEKKK